MRQSKYMTILTNRKVAMTYGKYVDEEAMALLDTPAIRNNFPVIINGVELAAGCGHTVGLVNRGSILVEFFITKELIVPNDIPFEYTHMAIKNKAMPKDKWYIYYSPTGRLAAMDADTLYCIGNVLINLLHLIDDYLFHGGAPVKNCDCGARLTTEEALTGICEECTSQSNAWAIGESKYQKLFDESNNERNN